jgi:hypothetical protein
MRIALAVGDDDVVPGRGLQQLVVVVDGKFLVGRRWPPRESTEALVMRSRSSSRSPTAASFTGSICTRTAGLLPADAHLRNARQLRELLRDHGLRVVIHLRDGHDVRVHRPGSGSRGIRRVDSRPAAPAGSRRYRRGVDPRCTSRAAASMLRRVELRRIASCRSTLVEVIS